MSQTPNDNNPTPETAGQTNAKPKPRPRRPLSRARKSAAEQAATPAPVAVENAPIAATPPPPSVESAPAQPTAQPAAPAKTGRSRGRRSGGPRQGGQPAVQLVKPAAPESAPETPTAGEPLPATITATEQDAPRIVPVVTEPTAAPEQPIAATTPLTLDTAEATQASSTDTREMAPVSRYRFGRRPTSPLATPAVRQERLSGVLTTPAESQEEAAPAPSASVAEAAPAAELRIEPPARRGGRDSIADIVSALGLQDLEARTKELAPPTDAPSQVANAPEAEPSEAAAAPSEPAATDDETANGDGEAVPGRRPRRRRRRGSGHAATGADEETDDQTPEPGESFGVDETAGSQESRNGYFDYPDTSFYHAEPQPYSPYERGSRERRATPEQSWDIGGGAQPSRQAESPYGSPEPSFARGFGPQPRGAAGPAREPYTRTGRNERGADTPPMSSNVLASTVTHAIQQQTDRLLAELRHQSSPPAMTVMLPQLPSTERIGVFVDVANLLYSSRNLRVAIDFGRLLDFLRGNRRLIRAHAYAPTNPDPHAEQAFLTAVKGLGYRITTKNYKTFASGAKKADMDLDLCMDIVRLVDAGSLDTVVLVSGDSDFLPLLEYCSDHGVRVEVAAFEDAAAMILRQSCDLFVNLSLVDEIRA